ncbi:MAG: hypothetical protein U0X92_12550 [Anaerolineales bacterium]
MTKTLFDKHPDLVVKQKSIQCRAASAFVDSISYHANGSIFCPQSWGCA